jgi:hypothetical protein
MFTVKHSYDTDPVGSGFRDFGLDPVPRLKKFTYL